MSTVALNFCSTLLPDLKKTGSLISWQIFIYICFSNSSNQFAENLGDDG